MKKSLTITTAIAATAILFSSCGISNLTIAKRHYRSGFYVEHKTNYLQPVASKIKPKAKNNVFTSIKRDNNSGHVQNPVIIQTAITKQISSKSLGTIARNVKKEKENNTSDYSVFSPNSKPVAADDISANSPSAMASSGSAGGGHAMYAPFWVCVLFAIFIPPLGVFLDFGIDIKFWVDLILTLLFFFPGMLFAIIVVVAD